MAAMCRINKNGFSEAKRNWCQTNLNGHRRAGISSFARFPFIYLEAWSDVYCCGSAEANHEFAWRVNLHPLAEGYISNTFVNTPANF